MVQDLHAHTFYSTDSIDTPETIIEAAIRAGIGLFGITDHYHGIGGRIDEYYEKLQEMKTKYKDKIRFAAGIEIATAGGKYLREDEDISRFDYCLVEQIDQSDSCMYNDIIGVAKRTKCKTGIAHTDLFRLLEKTGEDPLAYFTHLAEHGIFWEMNVNYDSIHGWREHPYYLEFLKNKKQQEIVRASGICLSVGFDGHRTRDYSPERVYSMCRFLEENKIPLVSFAV